MTIDEAIKEFQSELRWAELNEYPYISKQKVEADKMAIKTLEQTRWIPVSERLPEERQQVLVDYCGSRGFQIIEFSKKEIWSFKAWMPLPEPYTAESEET